jgi:hypothetical protein
VYLFCRTVNVKIFRFILAVLLSTVLPAITRADLKWEQTALELHPGFVAKEAVGHFKYENAGKTPVRFKSVRSSCGCTAAQSQKDQVLPGEKGEITATFTIGGRTGIQVKNVTVETDDPANPVTVLTLTTVVPQLLVVKPTFVYWAAGEEPKAKTITVTAAKDLPAKNLTVTSSNADFLTKVEEVKSPGEWKIDIEPKQTAHPMAAALTIQTDFPKDPPRLFYATATVTSAPQAQ